MSKKQESRAGFGREVRKQMLDLGLTQREVAARVPMRYQYLNKNAAGEQVWR